MSAHAARPVDAASRPPRSSVAAMRASGDAGDASDAGGGLFAGGGTTWTHIRAQKLRRPSPDSPFVFDRGAGRFVAYKIVAFLRSGVDPAGERPASIKTRMHQETQDRTTKREEEQMTITPKPLGIVAVLSIVGTVGATSFSTNVHAEDGCHRVRGRIQSLFTTTNCTSSVGLCTEGKITGAGELDSATTFLALDAAPSAGLPSTEPSANLSYSGVLTIKTRRGKLV